MDTFRKVGLTTCIALVLANMVGTGVFTMLGFQVGPLGSPFLILMVWALGGVVALCGALSYAELASALPRSGGEYNFLSQIYHPAIGFMGGFVSATVAFSVPIALAAMAFGRYVSVAFAASSPLVPLVASVVIVLFLALVHSLTVKTSGNFQIVVTFFKVFLIAIFVALGVWKSPWSQTNFLPLANDPGKLFSSGFAVSLMYVLYAYSGWNAAAYIIGEVREPQRTVPRALLLGTLLVMVLYVAINAVFLAAAPMSEYVNVGSDGGKLEVGAIAATHLLGVHGGRIMSTLISIGLISVLSAMTWAGPRVAQTIGRDFRGLALFARTSPGGIPHYALFFQTALVVLMLLTSTFDKILIYVQVAIEICAALTVLGVIVLRLRRPDLPRPFRCWGYPFTPLIFLALSLFAIVETVTAHPMESLAGISTLLLGIALYFLVRRSTIKS